MCYVPNGHRISVAPIFGGFRFESIDKGVAASLPTSWTIFLGTRKDFTYQDYTEGKMIHDDDEVPLPFTKPTRFADFMFISSISYSPTDDLKPTSAPSRQIAMVIWATCWWYFHEPEPDPFVSVPYEENGESENGRISVDWRLGIRQDGILKADIQMQKLERMGLITSTDSSVGTEQHPGQYRELFVSQSAFWQLDPRVYLFTLSSSPPSDVTPQSSDSEMPSTTLDSLGPGFPFGAGPNTNGTYLPQYYPPAPLQFRTTNNVRHPIRPKAPRQGEVVYSRYIPSVGQYLTFRTAAKDRPKPGNSHIVTGTKEPNNRPFPNTCLGPECQDDLRNLCDWMNDRDTSTDLIRRGSISVQDEFLEERLCSQNSFPLIGCLGKESFGYFETYWVLEDELGRLLGDADLWDRALHCLIAKPSFRSGDKVKIWLSSLVHYCFLADARTQRVFADVKADNER